MHSECQGTRRKPLLPLRCPLRTRGSVPLSPTTPNTEALEGTVSLPSCCVTRATAHGTGLFATRAIGRGETVLRIQGRSQSQPTRYSIQIDEATHIECEDGLDERLLRERYPWRFLNHSCAPNARIAGRTLVAQRSIAEGEEITFDYTTTEADMAEPFSCQCGAQRCLGTVRGFTHLSDTDRHARAALLAPHLKAILGEPRGERTR